jgi:hypothetical protein
MAVFTGEVGTEEAQLGYIVLGTSLIGDFVLFLSADQASSVATPDEESGTA